jgi:hypothetical protein
MLEANRPRTKIVITSLPSSRDEWVKESQAGVAFWVHQETGEVKTECPYDETRPSTANMALLKKKQMRDGGCGAQGEEEEEEATGALVYESSEYEEYLRMLGGAEEENRGTTKTSSLTASGLVVDS